MAIQFSYPTNAEIMEIEQELMPRLMADRPIFKWCGLKNSDAARVAWEQKDNYAGLQQLRGYEGTPQRVNAVGGARYSFDPGVYGEYAPINEQEITERRGLGTFGTPMKVDELVMDRSAQLQLRFLDRVEWSLWQALQGNLYVSARGGKLALADSFAVQKYSATTAWSSTALAGPLQDLRNVQLLSRGKSTSFGADSTLLVNRQWANYLLANTNPNDLYSKRPTGLSTILSIDQLNQVLSGEGLPQIMVYDQGYLSEAALGSSATSANYQLYIPNNTAILIGKRPGNANVANYLLTRNANNPDAAPGQYTKVVDKGDRQVPRVIEVHNGHNGGPAVFYPGSVVVLSV